MSINKREGGNADNMKKISLYIGYLPFFLFLWNGNSGNMDNSNNITDSISNFFLLVTKLVTELFIAQGTTEIDLWE